MSVVEVTTGARLHFGLVCGPPQSPFRFGGIGLMLRDPGWSVSVRPSTDCTCLSECTEVRQRVERLLPGICNQYQLNGVHVEVHRDIPLHHGLGAGTQLAFAVAAGIRITAGYPRPANSVELATSLQRSRRSAIGTFGFDHGGLIVDHGESPDESPRHLTKHQLPDTWRVVLLSPRGGPGLSGSQEESVFQQQRYMSNQLAAQQMGLIQDEIIPAATDGDFSVFSEALGQFGRNAGLFFSPQQGGIFSSSVIRELAASADFQNLRIVQSSWGPSVAVFAPSHQHAYDLTSQIGHSAFASQITCQIAEPLNQAATIRTTAPEISDHVARG